MVPIRIEAEAMTRWGYASRSATFASEGRLVSLSYPTGTVTTTFVGFSGVYNIVVGYFDENDGLGQLSLKVAGTTVDSWNLDQATGTPDASTQSFRKHTINEVTLKQGNTIVLEGILDGGETAQIDYIELIPFSDTLLPPPIEGTSASETLTGGSLDDQIFGGAGSDVLNGEEGNDLLEGGMGSDTLNGGAGSDTASFTQASMGVTADLSAGIANRTAKIMPLGDSITYGYIASSSGDLESGGYRTWLWQKFQGAGLSVDFVGSRSTGPATLGDKNHNGYPGRTIDWIDARVNGYLTTSQPDVVMLMIGTNDTATKTVSMMVDQLEVLIDKITSFSPDLQLLLATIPPIRSDAQSAIRVQRAIDYNAMLPSVVADETNVTLVDMTSLTQADITAPPADNGLHPTWSGYEKISNFWYDALTDIGVNQNTFTVDQDSLNNIENLVGSAHKDTLIGNAEANVIDGGNGDDLLTGNGGSDTFVYDKLYTTADTISDFDSNDVLRISATKFGGGLRAGVALSNNVFSTRGTFVVDGVPLGKAAHFLYNSSNGVLRFDSDGTGSRAPTVIATLTGAPALSASQFEIVA